MCRKHSRGTSSVQRLPITDTVRATELTAAAIDPEGWFSTGDLARMRNGALRIVGRSKELIVRSGFNVYPPEVEAVLNAHPDVTLSAVVGCAVPGNGNVVAFA